MPLDYERLWQKNQKLKSFHISEGSVIINEVKLPKEFNSIYQLYFFYKTVNRLGISGHLSLFEKERIDPKSALKRSLKNLIKTEKVKPFLLAADLKQTELYRIALMMIPFYQVKSINGSISGKRSEWLNV